MKRIMSKEELERFKDHNEKDPKFSYQNTLGKRIRNSWGLHVNSPTKKYFNKMGITKTDYMSLKILTEFHRHLINEGPKMCKCAQFMTINKC